MKTRSNSKKERQQYLFDCENFTLGRLATRAAFILQGKHKADFFPNKDEGGSVVIINSAKIRVTGKKRSDKMYHRFSGYPGGISSRRMEEILEKSPEKVLREAIYGMLPKNKLRNRMMKRINIFSDEKHGFKGDLKEVKKLFSIILA